MKNLIKKCVILLAGEKKGRWILAGGDRVASSLTLKIRRSFRILIAAMTWRGKMKSLSRTSGGLKLHLGCGERHFDDMLNCEFRPTRAADVVMDCADLSRFAGESVRVIFSHAFLEHLPRNRQLPLIQDCFRILAADGSLIFLGLPDFEVIADAYLRRIPGIVAETFDLYHVYRYTHGDPEGVGPDYWLEQLHKTLFDKATLRELLTRAGFHDCRLFNYCYPGEKIPLNLGCVAWKNARITADIQDVLTPFREYFNPDYTLIMAGAASPPGRGPNQSEK
jgi:hypothetical protein